MIMIMTACSCPLSRSITAGDDSINLPIIDWHKYPQLIKISYIFINAIKSKTTIIVHVVNKDSQL